MGEEGTRWRPACKDKGPRARVGASRTLLMPRAAGMGGRPEGALLSRTLQGHCSPGFYHRPNTSQNCMKNLICVSAAHGF